MGFDLLLLAILIITCVLILICGGGGVLAVSLTVLIGPLLYRAVDECGATAFVEEGVVSEVEQYEGKTSYFPMYYFIPIFIPLGFPFMIPMVMMIPYYEEAYGVVEVQVGEKKGWIRLSSKTAANYKTGDRVRLACRRRGLSGGWWISGIEHLHE